MTQDSAEHQRNYKDAGSAKEKVLHAMTNQQDAGDA